MCRLLYVRSPQPQPVREHLARFAAICRDSSEYQGHGWGAALLGPSGWQLHKWIEPIWEHGDFDLGQTTCLVAHARSAFRNEGIVIENNMPFERDGFVFAFNGELRGVRLNLPGRTGAEKIFELMRRLDRGDRAQAFRQAIRILQARSDYVRALNVILTDGNELHVASLHAEQPDYFALHRRRGRTDILCSQPLGQGFAELPNGLISSERSEAVAC